MSGILNQEQSEILMRLFIGAMCYRLGGEVTFTPDQLQSIQEEVGGVQVGYDAARGTYVLRVRDHGRAKEIAEAGGAF